MLKQDPTAAGKCYDPETHQWVDAGARPASAPESTPAAPAADQPAAEE